MPNKHQAPPKPVTNLGVTFTMSIAHITWTYPTTRADVANTPISSDARLTATVYDTASPTPSVPIGSQGNAPPGGQGFLDYTVVPGSSHGFYVTDSDGTLISTPTATLTAVAPSAPPNPVSNLAVTFI